MSKIQFRIAAKTDMGCVRTNNEDNFQAAADLSQPTMSWVNNATYDLGEKGALLVVADGMGGMNAGEVASEIAIATIKDFFRPELLTPEVLKNRFTIEKYMKEAVVEADRRIKAQSNAQTRGMGTTIVMAWLLDGQCYVCWCGDSRAYIYNSTTGLFQISKDHSYVQTLVDAGKISEEDAFDYPDSNVITRCLCDATQKAEPECLVKPQPLCDGDIIILCSDGLSGMLRDRDLKQIIAAHTDNIDVLTEALIAAALKAGGNDNVTVAAAQILSGGAKSTPARIPAKVAPHAADAVAPAGGNSPKGSLPSWVWAFIGFIVIVALAVAAYFAFFNKTESKDKEDPTKQETTTGADEQSASDEPVLDYSNQADPAASKTAAPGREKPAVNKGADKTSDKKGDSDKTGTTSATDSNNPSGVGQSAADIVAGTPKKPTPADKPGSGTIQGANGQTSPVIPAGDDKGEQSTPKTPAPGTDAGGKAPVPAKPDKQ